MTGISDRPGHNTQLRPDAAPHWLRAALGAQVPRRPEAWKARPLPAGHRQPASHKESAVLVALRGDSADTAEVLLTHRSPTMRSHSGQIAFPGGRIDPGDINAVDAALREAWEETGLDRMAVTPLEQWHPLEIQATGAPVSTIIAHWHSHSPVAVTSIETDDVFTVPLKDLIDPASRLSVGFYHWVGPAFRVRDYMLWGFTARVLDGLISHAGWEQPWDTQTVIDLNDALASSRNNENI